LRIQFNNRKMSTSKNKKAALYYHAKPTPGKIAVVPTKKHSTQRDLALAYSPGVAQPCLEIEENPEDVYKYTSKGNLVAVISNGTAVLGLGDIGVFNLRFFGKVIERQRYYRFCAIDQQTRI